MIQSGSPGRVDQGVRGRERGRGGKYGQEGGPGRGIGKGGRVSQKQSHKSQKQKAGEQ